jgi:Uma2 family endonuclease
VPGDRRHYQLFGGVIVAMAPPGTRHQRIAGVLAGALYNAVEAKLPGCAVLVQAGIAPHGVRGRDRFESDIAVTCEPPRDDRRGIVEQPLLIVEVLSPGTERDDVFVKLPAHRRIAGLREILYVETERVAASVYRRSGNGRETIAIDGRDERLRLDTIGLDLPPGALYRGIAGL